MDNKSDRRAHHVIYKTTCLITRKWYLGMHSTNNLDDGYYGSGTHLRRSLKKYGKENHKYEIIETLPTRAALRLREQEILTEEFIADSLCMNIRFSCSAGNDPGFWATRDRAETSKKISESAKEMWARRKANPQVLSDYIAKINKPEHIAKRAEATKAKGYKRTAEQLDRMKSGQSKYYSEQTKEQKLIRQRKGSWGRVKTYKIEDAEGNVQLISNLQEFSAKHNIKGTALYKTELRKTFANGFRIIGRE